MNALQDNSYSRVVENNNMMNNLKGAREKIENERAIIMSRLF